MKHAQRGFTLVEVMIALGLLAMMGVAIARSMAVSFETKDKVSKLNDRYHEGRQVMSRMARELRMAFLRADVPRDEQEERPSVQTRFKGEEDELYLHVHPMFASIRVQRV